MQANGLLQQFYPGCIFKWRIMLRQEKKQVDVIGSSGASLEGEYSKVFNNTDPSSEDIFVLPITAQDGDNDLHLFWSTPIMVQETVM